MKGVGCFQIRGTSMLVLSDIALYNKTRILVHSR